MKITQHCGRRGIWWSEDSPGLTMERAVLDRDPFQAGSWPLSEMAAILAPFFEVPECRVEPCVIDGTVC